MQKRGIDPEGTPLRSKNKKAKIKQKNRKNKKPPRRLKDSKDYT
jgi:hypothetical protein